MIYKDKFKKFGGDKIDDIIGYLSENIQRDPNITISVGCDSKQFRKKTQYAVTIMLYSNDIRNGAHVVFFRENFKKIRNNEERLIKESTMAYEVATYLDVELSKINYIRKDLTDNQLRYYKYHLMYSNGEFSNVQITNLDKVINRIPLTDGDKSMVYKLVDIHLDYNPFEGTKDKKGFSKNRSNPIYKSHTPWLRSLGFRIFCKNVAHAASSAADLLLKG